MANKSKISLILYDNSFGLFCQYTDYNARDILALLAKDLLIYKNPIIHDAEIMEKIKGWPVPKYVPRLMIMATPIRFTQAESGKDVAGYHNIPLGFLPKVRDFLKGCKASVEVKITDKSSGSGKVMRTDLVKNKFTPTEELRGYQNQIVGQLAQHRRAQAISMTGSGKTIIMSHLVKHLGCPTVILVHRLLLIPQWVNAIKSVTGKKPFTLSEGKITVGDAPIVIASFRSLGEGATKSEKKLLSTKVFDDIRRASFASGVLSADELLLKEDKILALRDAGLDLENQERLTVIIDEAHVAPAFMYYSIASALKATYVFACTATPDRKDGRGMFMEALFSGRQYQTEPDEVQRFLAPIKYLTIEIDGYFTDVVDRLSGPKVFMDHEFIRELASDPVRFSYILNVVKAFKAQGLTLAIICGNNLWLVEAFQTALDSTNVKHGTITGSTKSEDRALIKQQLLDKSIDVLIATTTVDEGVDIPSLDGIMFPVPFSSAILTIQRSGRVARKADGKECGIVIDVLDKALVKTKSLWSKRKNLIHKTFEVMESIKLQNPNQMDVENVLVPKAPKKEEQADGQMA